MFQSLPPSSHDILPVSVSLFSLLRWTPVIGIGPTHLNLSNYIGKDPIPNKETFTSLGQACIWGGGNYSTEYTRLWAQWQARLLIEARRYLAHLLVPSFS